MFTQLLTHIDWLSLGAGVTAGAVLYSVVAAQLRKKLNQQISEQQQQLSLLQNQFDNKELQYNTLLEDHELLEHTHQEQRDEAQHFKTRFSEQEKQSVQYNHFWRKAEGELTALREQFNQRDIELNNMRTTLEQNSKTLPNNLHK